MAKPIGATPVLTGKEAAKFIARVQKEVKTKVGLTPTPKLETARDLIKQYGKREDGEQ